MSNKDHDYPYTFEYRRTSIKRSAGAEDVRDTTIDTIGVMTLKEAEAHLNNWNRQGAMPSIHNPTQFWQYDFVACYPTPRK